MLTNNGQKFTKCWEGKDLNCRKVVPFFRFAGSIIIIIYFIVLGEYIYFILRNKGEVRVTFLQNNH